LQKNWHLWAGFRAPAWLRLRDCVKTLFSVRECLEEEHDRTKGGASNCPYLVDVLRLFIALTTIEHMSIYSAVCDADEKAIEHPGSSMVYFSRVAALKSLTGQTDDDHACLSIHLLASLRRSSGPPLGHESCLTCITSLPLRCHPLPIHHHYIRPIDNSPSSPLLATTKYLLPKPSEPTITPSCRSQLRS